MSPLNNFYKNMKTVYMMPKKQVELKTSVTCGYWFVFSKGHAAAILSYLDGVVQNMYSYINTYMHAQNGYV